MLSNNMLRTKRPEAKLTCASLSPTKTGITYASWSLASLKALQGTNQPLQVCAFKQCNSTWLDLGERQSRTYLGRSYLTKPNTCFTKPNFHQEHFIQGRLLLTLISSWSSSANSEATIHLSQKITKPSSN